MKYLLIPFAIFLLNFNLTVQQSGLINIKGKVTDEETGAPLEDVNVFLSGTTIGTSTDKNGRYYIKNVPYGAYSIVFSFIGYQTGKRNFYSYKTASFEFNVTLTARAVKIGQVNITGAAPEDWKDNLKLFEKIFLGTTENSGDTKILNPEVLNLVRDKKSHVLKAYADSILKVENRSLGYKIYIVLDSLRYTPHRNFMYMFFPRFQELTPVSADEKQKWMINRRQTYLDSPKHFFYALVHKQLDKDYFALHEGTLYVLMNGKGVSISPEKLKLSSNGDSTIYTFNFSGGLKITRFMNDPSYLNFFYPSIDIDKYGNLITSFYTFEIFGHWADQGIADLLPENYIYEKK